MNLPSSGNSPVFVAESNGVHIKVKDMTGTITFEQFIGTTSLGNIKDANNSNQDISYTADFDILLDLRKGDNFRIVQTGGTPANTIYSINNVREKKP